MTTIAQLRELEEKATGSLLIEQLTGQFGTFGIAPGGHLTVKPLEPADAEFIVAFRNIAPKLIALWEAADSANMGHNWDCDLSLEKGDKCTCGVWELIGALDALEE